jgi:hypothetical protein
MKKTVNFGNESYTMKATKHANGVKDLDVIRMPPPISTQLKPARRQKISFLRKILRKVWIEKAVDDQLKMIKKKFIAAQRKAFMSSMAKRKLKRKQRSFACISTRKPVSTFHFV